MVSEVDRATAYVRVFEKPRVPCSGIYTRFAPATPEDGHADARLTICHLAGVLMRDGLYRVRFERIGDG